MQDTVRRDVEKLVQLSVPDFIIGGAPKCGTTSLEHVLNAHPRIQIPKGEVFFFDADDPLNHGDFNWGNARHAGWPEFVPPPSAQARWYEDYFPARQENLLIGEDSTTYLFSPVAAYRLARYLPKVKLIFALRDPVERAASQYRHLVMSGRATTEMAQAIADYPSIVRWSSYEEALRTYFAIFPREQIHLFLFERFVADPQREVDAVFDFLSCNSIELGDIETQYNVSRHPFHLRTYLIVNRALNLLPDRRYGRHFARSPRPAAYVGHGVRVVLKRLLDRVLLTGTRAVPIADDTLRYLRQHLRERNEGLAALCNIDFSAYWTTMR